MSIILDGNNLTTVGIPNLGTAQASTSGTSIDFTGIPAGVKRITVMFNGVSGSGTSNFLLQIGAGSITSSGYSSSAWTTNTNNSNSTAGFIMIGSNGSVNTWSGMAIISSFGSNAWVFSSNVAYQAVSAISLGSGSVTLSGTLDRVRITTVNGTDTFDAGSINILYE